MKFCQKVTRLYAKKPNAGGDHMLDVITVGKTISVGQKLSTHFQPNSLDRVNKRITTYYLDHTDVLEVPMSFTASG
jgi:hypothetical protein